MGGVDPIVYTRMGDSKEGGGNQKQRDIYIRETAKVTLTNVNL